MSKVLGTAVANFLGAVDHSAGAWADAATAAGTVAGHRKDVTTLLSEGPEALRGGRETAYTRGREVAHLKDTLDIAVNATDIVRRQRDALTKALESDHGKASGVLEAKLSTDNPALTPALESVSARPTIRSWAAHHDAHRSNSEWRVANIVKGWIATGTTAGAIADGISLINHAAATVNLSVGPGIATGVTATTAATVIGFAKIEPVRDSASGFVTELDKQVQAALRGNPLGWRAGHLTTKRSVGRLSQLTSDIQTQSSALKQASTGARHAVSSGIDDTEATADHTALTERLRAETQRAAAESSGRHVAAWRQALKVDTEEQLAALDEKPAA